jgi:hypothetical protein
MKELIELIDWLTDDDTGESSKAIVRFMLGLPPKNGYYSYPHDFSDRGRCIRLLNRIPKWWERLDEMGKLPLQEVNVFTNAKIEVRKSGWAEQISFIKKEAKLSSPQTKGQE